MRLLPLSLLLLALFVVSVEGAKKKARVRDRDEGQTSKQTDEDVIAKPKDTDDIRRKEDRRREKEEKEEKPLKKADDESSDEDEDEDDKKEKEDNGTIIIPPNGRPRRHHGLPQAHGLRSRRSEYGRDEVQEHQYNLPEEVIPSKPEVGRQRRSGGAQGELVLSKAQELNGGEKVPYETQESSRPEYRKKSRSRRDHHHSQDGHTHTLSKATELNGGEKVSFEAQDSARPEYRKKSRSRRAHDHTHERHNAEPGHTHTLSKATEINGGEKVSFEAQDSARPEYRKKSRSRRDHPHPHGHAEPGHTHTLTKANELNDGHQIEHKPHKGHKRHIPRVRRTLTVSDSSGSSEEQTLKKATELNDGEKRPIDAKSDTSKATPTKGSPRARRSHQRLGRSFDTFRRTRNAAKELELIETHLQQRVIMEDDE